MCLGDAVLKCQIVTAEPRLDVSVYQAVLTTWHVGRWRGGCVDAATQLTNSGKSSWKPAMVLQQRESRSQALETHECRKRAGGDTTQKGRKREVALPSV